MRIAIVSCLVVFLISCTAESTKYHSSDPKPILLSGMLTNLTDTTLTFTYTPFELLATSKEEKIEVDSVGAFEMEFESAVPVKGFLSFGKVPANYAFNITQINGKDSSLSVESVDFRMVWFWLEPDDNLTMNVNPDRIGETLAFSGDATANNIFVNSEESVFNSYKQKYLWNYYYITYCEPDDYKQRVDRLLENKLNFLHENSETYQLSPALTTFYESEYYSGSIGRKINYPASHAGFNKDQPIDLPRDYFNFMDEVVLDPETSDKGIGYYYFLKNYLTKKMELSGLDVPGSDYYYDYVRDQLPQETFYQYIAWALARDFRKQLYDQFGDQCPYPEIAMKVKERYHNMEGLLEGSPAPDVTLRDINDTPISLNTLKGKYVYIDFWATWCVPCIKEIPYLKQIEEKYDDQNIQFVSISFDKQVDHEKWRNFVLKNELSGIQFIADETTHATLSQVWNIDLIPRFVLLDPENRIVDSNAPRPSDPKLVELLNSLNMK